MAVLNDVLVVLGDDREQATFVLEKARVLALAADATLHVVRVVYEGVAELPATVIDASTDLKTFILESEETVTEDMVASLRGQVAKLETATLWNRRTWQGILHAAEQAEADLIVRAATRHHRFGEVVRTPDDWNLLRQSPVPVLLVKPQAWVSEPVVLCALDAFDEAHDALNRALLVQGADMARILGGSLHVVVAYPLFERWVGELGGLRDYDTLKRDIETELRNRVVHLAEQAGVEYAHLYADEGPPEQVIVQLAENLDAELVVVGSHARQGLKGMLLGNTSERLLHHLPTDLMTVHAQQES
jgi:universal stress protein E